MASALNPAEAPSWWDFVTKFDATYKSFNDNFSALLSLKNYIYSKHPELISTYNRMVADGQANVKKLTELKATRDYVLSWLQWLDTGAGNVAAFVQSSAQSAYDFALRELGLGEYEGLGFVPLAVAIAGAAAGIAALVVIAKWITDAYTFAQRLNALQSQEAKGLTPQEASQVVNAALGQPPTNDFLGIPWSLLVWGAIAVFLGPPVIKAITDRGYV